MDEFLAVWTGRTDGYDPWIWGLYRCEMCERPCWASLFFTKARYLSDEKLGELKMGIVRKRPLPEFVQKLERDIAKEKWWIVKRDVIVREWEHCVCHDLGYDADTEGVGGKDTICKVEKCKRICFEQYLDHNSEDSDNEL